MLISKQISHKIFTAAFFLILLQIIYFSFLPFYFLHSLIGYLSIPILIGVLIARFDGDDEDRSEEDESDKLSSMYPIILWAVFFIFFKSFAYDYKLFFYPMSMIGLILVFICICCAYSDFIKFGGVTNKESLGSFVSAVGFILFLSYYPLKGAYVTHYGVPIIGHYLEKYSYDAKYYLKIYRIDGNSSRTYKVLGEIHVNNGYEEVGAHEDRSGIERSFFGEIHEITVKRFKFPTGGWIEVDSTDERVTLHQSGMVTDTSDRTWSVELLRESVQN